MQEKVHPLNIDFFGLLKCSFKMYSPIILNNKEQMTFVNYIVLLFEQLLNNRL